MARPTPTTTTRTIRTGLLSIAALRSEGLGQGVNFLRVEHLVVALEQPGNGGPVDLHLCAADAAGPVADDAVPIGRLVQVVHPFDARRRHPVEVDRHAQAR